MEQGEVDAQVRTTPLGNENLVVVERGTSGTRFTINSALESVEEAEAILTESFAGKLQTYRVDVGEVDTYTEDDIEGATVALTFNDGEGFSDDDGVARDALLARQRAFALSPGLVADGRDMGTVVFQDAPLKIYLNASAEERARRRYAQLKEKGFDATLATLIEDIQTRDDRDMNRDVAPLKPAEDAVEIDSTSLSVEQVVDAILDEAARRSLV